MSSRGIILSHVPRLKLSHSGVVVAACEQEGTGLQTAVFLSQRSLQTSRAPGLRSLQTDQHSYANSLPTTCRTNRHCKERPQILYIQSKGHSTFYWRHTHRFKRGFSEINHRVKRSFTLETAYRGEVEACRPLIIQPLAHLPGVLVHGYVCKPFAYECWLVCTE
jgi:hypothetical protein